MDVRLMDRDVSVLRMGYLWYEIHVVSVSLIATEQTREGVTGYS